MTLWCANKRWTTRVNAWTRARRSLIARSNSSGSWKSIVTTNFRSTATASTSLAVAWNLNRAVRHRPCTTSVYLKNWASSDPNTVSFARRACTLEIVRSHRSRNRKCSVIFQLVLKTSKKKNDRPQNMDNVIGLSSNQTVHLQSLQINVIISVCTIEKITIIIMRSLIVFSFNFHRVRKV